MHDIVFNGFQPSLVFLSDSQISYQLLRDLTPPLSCSIHRIRLPKDNRFSLVSRLRDSKASPLPVLNINQATDYHDGLSHSNGLTPL